tara:strand:+ start:22 stop:459 length:438 start_codon:yes stop_codon:yes gene_type:complete
MINWVIKDYNALSANQLYALLQLRQEVFIIEQNCNYLDADGYDLFAKHVMCYQKNELIAYMRIVYPGKIYDTVSFGRILVKKSFRGMGYGKQIVKQGIQLFPENEKITMSAQLYLKKMYESFDFQGVGEEYLEDQIPHIKMVRNG